MRKTLAILRIVASGSLGNRAPEDMANFIGESGETITRVQYATFEVLLIVIILLSGFLSYDEISAKGLDWHHLYEATAFPEFVYTLICILLIRFRWVSMRRMIIFQIATFIPLLTNGLLHGGGLIDTGMMWMMCLPYLAQIYGGGLFSIIVTIATVLSVAILAIAHYKWQIPPAIIEDSSRLFRSTLVALFGIGIAGVHVMYQSLKQRRLFMIEQSLFHVRNSQSTVATVREMAGAVAHQMNTPLSTYFLAIEQVRMQLPLEQAANPEVQTILQQMDSAIDRITQVNRSLLVVTSHSGAHTPSNIDLRKIMNIAIEAFRNSSRQEHPQITVVDNNVTQKIIAPEGALSQYLWRIFSICEEQLHLKARHTETSDLKFQIDIQERSNHVELKITADLVNEVFSADFAESLILLGTHMMGPSAQIDATLSHENHVEVLLAFQKAGTTSA